MYAFFILWCLGSNFASKWGIGPLYLITTGFALIFMNLGSRQDGEQSAYSVFNEGFRELPGTMNAGIVDQNIRHENVIR